MPSKKPLALTKKRLSVLPLHRRRRAGESLREKMVLSRAKVRAFDKDGNMTTKECGARSFYLRHQTLFYHLRSCPWSWLMAISIVFYLSLVLWITALYHGWAWACGVHGSTSPIVSLYFTVVSLAANGGYMGEAASMGNPSNVCYYGRTFIVMLASFTNIIFVGLVAALVVGKVENTAKFAHRIIFSHFCTLARVTGKEPAWRLKFRMANIASKKPFAQGKLRLFCILAEPLDEHYSSLGASQMSETIKGKRSRTFDREIVQPQSLLGSTFREGQEEAPSNTFIPANEAGLSRSYDPMNEDSARLAKSQETPRRRRGGKGYKKQGPTKLERASEEEKDDQSPRFPSFGQKEDEGLDEETKNSTSERDPRPFVAVRVHSEKKESTFSDYGGTSEVGERGIPPAHTQERIGNTPQVENQNQANAFPTEEDYLLGQTRVTEQQECSERNSIAGGEDSGCIQQVKLKVVELQWSCLEEQYREKEGRQLSLWYPATICHLIDKSSPLFRFLYNQFSDPSFDNSTDADRCPLDNSFTWMDMPECFQIVAVFDAIEMESGATITEKHTYTYMDILRNYRFSNNLTHIHTENAEIHLDYHFFDVVHPIVEDASSTN